MITHTVMFKLDGFKSLEEKNEHLNRIKEAFETLPDEIEQLIDLKVAININPEEKDFDFLLKAHVPHVDDLALYAEHPAHVSFVKGLIAPYKVARACVDYISEL
ncbi:Dabb family protein [Porphyromonas pogonae]|uniref:Dabb family protein n=1 Tax=Porphyromonas pogonae TaxID=867595 RepID=UPI002E79FC4C|nr:Dabb family protein [Porphyromonas pogonae]